MQAKLSNKELRRLLDAARRELRSQRTVIAIQRAYIRSITGKDVDEDLKREMRK